MNFFRLILIEFHWKLGWNKFFEWNSSGMGVKNVNSLFIQSQGGKMTRRLWLQIFSDVSSESLSKVLLEAFEWICSKILWVYVFDYSFFGPFDIGISKNPTLSISCKSNYSYSLSVTNLFFHSFRQSLIQSKMYLFARLRKINDDGLLTRGGPGPANWNHRISLK